METVKKNAPEGSKSSYQMEEEEEEEEEGEEEDTEEEAESDETDSDDSEQDPTFDVLEETDSRFSRISIKMTKARNERKKIETEGDLDIESLETTVPELSEKDKKSYGKIAEIIKENQFDKLKVDDCKVYLRNHGLRLTGNKDILMNRIKEHLDIINGGGEKKYPVSSFILNCKGDACTGDVVIFEQNVYDSYNIASRSAINGPCGTRIIVGRIVKESYGAAKQQHTFTIEVLWSKGEKPLPPLHSLLIKGRNLYRLKIMRQKWIDEDERKRILLEKHSRGSSARLLREIRIQGKEEMRNKKRTRKREANSTLHQINLHNRNQINSNEFQRAISGPSNFSLKSHLNHSNSNAETFHNQFHSMNARVHRHPLPNASSADVLLFPEINRDSMLSDLPLWNDTAHVHSQSKVEYSGILAKEPVISYGSFRRLPLTSLHHTHSLESRHRNQPKKMKPCRFFPQGRCYYGDECRYLH